MSTASEWSAVIMGGVQFAAGTGLAFYTLRKQHIESIAQREGEWFHLVVADKTIDELHSLVEGEAIALDTASRRCIAAKVGGLPQPVVDQCFRDEIQAFRSRLAPIRRRVSHLAFTFDQALYLEVSKRFQGLEDKIAEWFDSLQREGPVDGKEDLMAIICDCQRELIASFRHFEFVTLPEAGRRRQRHSTAKVVLLFVSGLIFLSAAITEKISHSVVAISIGGKYHVLGEWPTFWVAATFAVYFFIVAYCQTTVNKKP